MSKQGIRALIISAVIGLFIWIALFSALRGLFLWLSSAGCATCSRKKEALHEHDVCPGSHRQHADGR